MSNQNQEVTTTPKDIVDELTLSSGTTYTIQHVGPVNASYIRIFEGAKAPVDLGRAGSFVLRPFEKWTLEIGTDPIWIMTLDGSANLAVGRRIFF